MYLLKFSFSFSECLDNNQGNYIKDIMENFYYGKNSSVIGNIETSYTTYWGKVRMLRQNYTLSHNNYLRIHLKSHEKYGLELHDNKFYSEASEQYVDFKRVSLALDKGFKKMIWLKIEQNILLPELSDCNNDEDYSFLICYKVMSVLHKLTCFYLFCVFT